MTPFPFSQTYISGSLLYVSGTIGRDPETGILAEGDLVEQTHQVIRNIAACLEKEGSSLSRVVKATIFLMDIECQTSVIEAAATFFHPPFPASTWIQVRALPDPAALIEIEVVAERTQS